MKNKHLKRIVAKAESLPPLPGVVAKVMELSSDPDFDVNDLVQTISMDPAITAAVLRQANSSFFGLRHKASTLAQAVPLLGLSNILEITLSSGVAGHFKAGAEGYRMPRAQLWRHSLAAALCSSVVCKELGLAEAPIIFTGALLHDVGKMVLSEFVAQEFGAIEDLVVQEGLPLYIAEHQVLGVSHAVVGEMVAKRWRLGNELRKAIAFHHNAHQAKEPRQVANAVSLANYLAVSSGVRAGVAAGQDIPPITPMKEMGITAERYQSLRDRINEVLAQAESILEMAP